MIALLLVTYEFYCIISETRYVKHMCKLPWPYMYIFLEIIFLCHLAINMILDMFVIFM